MNRISKRAVALLLALAMVFSSLVVVSAEDISDFSDFPTGWSAEAMTAAVNNGLLYGMGDGTIAPKANLTRAQMAAIINRAFGATVQADISAFTDVSADAWYYNDVAKAVNMGTFAGVSDNSMNPESDITRQEAFAVMARALVLTADDSSALSKFGDGQSVASWAIADVCALIERGYVNGYTDGLLCPTANITREEFAQMMHNIIKTYITKPGDVSQVNSSDCVMIRTPGVTIHDVKIEGDLILGDGVGRGDVNITNVEIGGRLLCRGGEGKVTLKNTVTGEGVVVKDVNGVVNFNNYRSESVFDGVREITKATYLKAGGDGDKINIGPVTGNHGSSSGPTGKFDVIFYYDEECTEEYKAFEIESGKTVATLPSNPSKTGRTFAGWFYKDANGIEKEFNTSVKISGDIKVYAKWNTTIKFYKDSGLTDEIDEFKDFPFGKTFKEAGISLPEKPDGVAGEEFAGWFYLDDEGSEHEFTEETPVSEEMKIYAKWRVFVTFYDRYDDTDGYVSQIGSPVEIIKGESLAKDSFPWDASDDKDETRQFVGWFYLDDDGAEAEFTETTPVTKAFKVYGKWNTSLKFYKDSEPTVIEITFETFPYGKTFKEAGISLPEKPDGVAGEEFAGWFYLDDEGKEHEFTEDTPVTKNMSIYAKWLVFVSFYDHYDETDGYVSQIGISIELEKGQSLAKDNFPWDASDDKDETRQFVGWFYLDDNGAEAEFTETTPVTKTVKVYGKWNTIVTFYKDSTLAEEACGPITISYGKTFANETLALPAKPDYDESDDFAGWFYEDEGVVKEFTESTPVTQNMTVYAKWGTMVIFYDRYDETDGYVSQIGSPVELIKGESFAESEKTLPDVDETDRTHAGWFYLDENETEVEFTVDTKVDSVLKVYGKWTVTVSFWDGFTLIPELNIETFTDVAYGSTITDIPENISYNGYVKDASVHSVYTEKETHHIMTDWWYLKEYEDGTLEWVVFDDSVKVIKNTDVFRMVKNISVDLDGELIEKLEAKIGEEAFVSIPYSPDTRLNDSVKDLVWSLRNRVDYALTETDAYDRLIAKLTSVNDMIIDADKNILNQAIAVKVIEVIAADEIEGEIENYIKTVVEHGGDELRTLLSFVDISELIDAVGPDYIINSLDDETLLTILRKDNVRPTAVSVLKNKIASDGTIRAEVIDFFVARLQSDTDFLAWFIEFIRTEVKAENEDIIELLAKYLQVALMSNEDLQDMAISIFIDKLKTSGDFRNTIISNDAFLTSVLNDPTLKSGVVDTIVGHVELIKDLIKDETVRGDIIANLEQNDAFLDFIVHHEYFEKEFLKAVKTPAHAAEIKAVLDEHPEMSEEIVGFLLKNTEFKNSLENADGDVRKLIVNHFTTGIKDSTSGVHKLVLDKAMSNTELKEELSEDNAVKSQLVNRVKTNEEVLRLIRVAVGIGENDNSLDSEIATALESYITNPDGSYEVYGTDYIPLIDAEVVKIIKGTTNVGDDIKDTIKAELSGYIAAHSDDSNVVGIINDYISGYADDPTAANSTVKEMVNSAIADRAIEYLNDTDDSDDSAAERKVDGFISSAMLDYAQVVITGGDTLEEDIKDAIEAVKSTCINSLLHSATASTETEELLNSFLTDESHRNELEAAVSSEDGYRDIVAYIIAHNDNPEHVVVKSGNDFFKNNADSIPQSTIKTYLTNNQLELDFVELLLTNNIDDIDDSVISEYVLNNLEELKGVIDSFVKDNAGKSENPQFDSIINDYILNALDVVTVAKFRSMFTDDPEIAELIKSYVSDDPNGAIEDVISVISNMTETEKIQFVDKVMVTLRSLSYYQEFINSFKNKDDTFVVNADNISFVMGVATAIKNYTYDSLRDRIRARFGQVIDLFGEDLVRRYFNNATQDYYDGALTIKNQIDADKAAGIDKDYEYTTSITFKANLMKDVIVPKYRAIMNKAIAKLDAAGIDDYDNNKYLKALVELDLIDELFEELPTGATDTLSGYKLKDDPMAYYDFVYALLVLADDAALFYDYVSYDQVVNRVTPHAVKLANKSIELLKEFDADGSLPGDIDGKLSSIDRIKGIYDSIEGIMNSVTDIIIGSEADKEYEDGTIKNDAVKAATKFINAFWEQLNKYNESGELPEKLKPMLNKSAKLKKIFEDNKDNIDALVEKIAKLKMNHVYTEEEVAEYERYVKHLYGMFNGTADPTFSIDTVYEIAEFFADDLLAGYKFTPEEVEGYVYIDAYHAGVKGVIGSVIRFFA